MKKIWLPYPVYFLKPFAVGLVGLVILYFSEDLFTSGFAIICLGYAGWIIFMRIMYSVKYAVKSNFCGSKDKKANTYFAEFPDE